MRLYQTPIVRMRCTQHFAIVWMDNRQKFFSLITKRTNTRAHTHSLTSRVHKRCIIELNEKELRVSVRKMCVINLACGRFKKLFIIFWTWCIHYVRTHNHIFECGSARQSASAPYNWFTKMASHTNRAQQMNSPFSLFFSFFQLEPFNSCVHLKAMGAPRNHWPYNH